MKYLYDARLTIWLYIATALIFAIGLVLSTAMADAHPKGYKHCHVTAEGCHD